MTSFTRGEKFESIFFILSYLTWYFKKSSIGRKVVIISASPKVLSDTLATVVEKLLFIHRFLLIKAAAKVSEMVVLQRIFERSNTFGLLALKNCK